MEDNMIPEFWSKIRLFHLTNQSNMRSILKLGLLSNSELKRLNIKFKDSSWNSVQDCRERTSFKVTWGEDPLEKNKYEKERYFLHEFVPLYFNCHTPSNSRMMHHRETNFCFIEIDNKIESDKNANYFFSDGNLAAEDSNIYCNLEDLDDLDWKIINETKFIDYKTNPDLKRKKCSEFLIYKVIPTKYFKRIIVCNKFLREEIQNLLNEFNLQIEVILDTKVEYF